MIALILLVSSLAQAAPVRELSLKPKEVGTVNTAIGYSTVIQLSQKPLNVVLGDQSAFRVEYINDSITIKPIRSSARTNLFIFTENDRFNLTLRVGPAGAVDYVVRLKRIFTDPKKTVLLNRYQTKGNIRVSLVKATLNNKETFLDFKIENRGKKVLTLNPELFRVVVDENVKSIRSLYLETVLLKPGTQTVGSILFHATGLGEKLTIWPGLKNEPSVSMTFNNKLEVRRAF